MILLRAEVISAYASQEYFIPKFPENTKTEGV